MENEVASLVSELGDVWRMATARAEALVLPSRLIQIAVIAVALGASFGAAHVIRPRMRAWMTGRDWPMWRLRALLVVNRRLWLIVFAVVMWLAVWIGQAVASVRGHVAILELAASLALGWLVVVVGSRLVRNPALRVAVRWGLLILVTLWVLGLIGEASDVLDAAAVTVGDLRLSLLTVLKAVVLLGLLIAGARVLSVAGSERIRASEDISPSLRVLLVKVLQIGLYGAALIVGIRAAGVDLTGLAVLSGAIGVGLGFGLQKVVSNLVSGVIILLDKSIKPGDVITTGETFGWVSTLGARYTSISTRDGKEFLIPNEDLITGQVVNWSHSNNFVRLDVYFGVAYHNDPHQVRRVAIAAASDVVRVLSVRKPVCHIVGFGDSSVDYILRFWISDPTGGLTNIRGDVYLALWDAFKAEGIDIPFPQREVKILEGTP